MFREKQYFRIYYFYSIQILAFIFCRYILCLSVNKTSSSYSFFPFVRSGATRMRQPQPNYGTHVIHSQNMNTSSASQIIFQTTPISDAEKNI